LGPPFYFRDHCIENGQELYEFYYNNTIVSAKLPYSIDDSLRSELTTALNNLTFDVFYDWQLQTILDKYLIII
jgi:hypothetical protein